MSEFRIKLSDYYRVNKDTILRNIFFQYCNTGDYNIMTTKDDIRDAVYSGAIEVDYPLDTFFKQLSQYIQANILDYSLMKKVLKKDHKAIISPKTTFKQYLEENIKQQYYIKNIMEAK